MSIRSDISMRLIPEVMKTTWLGETIIHFLERMLLREEITFFMTLTRVCPRAQQNDLVVLYKLYSRAAGASGISDERAVAFISDYPNGVSCTQITFTNVTVAHERHLDKRITDTCC